MESIYVDMCDLWVVMKADRTLDFGLWTSALIPLTVSALISQSDASIYKMLIG
jgi:hypothetical protein